MESTIHKTPPTFYSFDAAGVILNCPIFYVYIFSLRFAGILTYLLFHPVSILTLLTN